MQKVFIKNRKNQKLAVVVEESPKQKGVAFVMHGLGGVKEGAHIRTFVETFLNCGYTVVSFDVANTIGESEGKIEDATTTNYYEDLQDVIGWAKSQSWYQEPFVLVGHSLGGLCTAWYAEKYPDKIKALAPISTVVSGELFEDAVAEELEAWERTGWRIKESKSKPGVMKKESWELVVDMEQYDLLKDVEKLTMPILLIVGEYDTSTPPYQQKLLFEKLPAKKEYHLIKGAPHTFSAPEHLKEIGKIFNHWIENLK